MTVQRQHSPVLQAHMQPASRDRRGRVHWTSRWYRPESVSCMGIQSNELKLAPYVDDVVHYHRDGACGHPQAYRPHEAALRLAGSILHVTPLLGIHARHRPMVRRRVGAERCRRPFEQLGYGVGQERMDHPEEQGRHRP
jgi:hypothetical protein